MQRCCRWMVVVAVSAALGGVALAGDWPQWGGGPSRNMVSPEKDLPDTFDPGKLKDGSEEVDLGTTKHVKWVARLGSVAYGNPTVAGGRVYVGTNNDPPKDPRHEGDRGVLLCLDEATGRLLWQLVSPKLPGGKTVDFEGVGICSSPAVDGERVYVVTNRCEVLCLDARGMSNGNDGPFVDEGQYMAGPGSPKVEVGPTDADIIWQYNMYDELGVFPPQQASSSVLVVGERVYATTSNGRDWSRVHVPSPDAPALICLDKMTGRLLGEERSGISRRTFNGNWSSPAYGEVAGRRLVIFGGGDGWCYAFDAEPVDGVLREVWRFDCNPPAYRMADGQEVPYGSERGPSEVIATPVFAEGKVYLTIGQAPEESSDGGGSLNCIDASKTGDITQSGKVWQNTEIRRSVSTAAVSEGVVYVADHTGLVYGFDAATGKMLWKHDSEAAVWGSPLVADGKVYIGNANGDLIVLAAGRQEKVINRVMLDAGVKSSPVAANGVLYVATENRLYAVGR